MLRFIIVRLTAMLITMFALSVILFGLLEFNLPKLAREMTFQRASDYDVKIWLEQEGFARPIVERYIEWVSGYFNGDLGDSYKKKRPIYKEIVEKLSNTAMLMGVTLLFMVPSALFVGVLAGMREGSKTDRSLSVFSILTTSLPDYISGVILLIFLGVELQLLPTISRTLFGEIHYNHVIMPALSLAIYAFGYIARMTRASMAEVMTTHYIRTAILKGLPYHQVIVKHALRNALIAPFTVIILQIPWLLTGVVAIELLFSYPGFGLLLLDASVSNDLPLIMACAMVTVFVVTLTQVISDVGYVMLNPRIRTK